MNFQKQRKKDDEMFSLFWIAFLSLGVLAAVNIWYSDWNGMFDTWAHWGAIVGGGGILAIVYFVVVMFSKWQDPAYDKYRHYVWVGGLLVIIFICGFKVAQKDRIESPQKQEQAQ